MNLPFKANRAKRGTRIARRAASPLGRMAKKASLKALVKMPPSKHVVQGAQTCLVVWAFTYTPRRGTTSAEGCLIWAQKKAQYQRQMICRTPRLRLPPQPQLLVTLTHPGEAEFGSLTKMAHTVQLPRQPALRRQPQPALPRHRGAQRLQTR
jgi:hypothetical protein